ncbi:MAG: aminodeoxychorismate/anthranilate synthase component II [Candidatus Methanoperedens sp.]|nr:aminodeoxychorismate/anthranilate synthase component II [Candidatus Methanoperedens sp.]MCE8429217.1 aminodeoxychorismate/anthranilate synthase component II [Candidatus Methanoperedens sp.]
MKVLFVNNRDSFVWNLVDYVSIFEPDTLVVPNTISLKEVKVINPDAIVISPGPGHPSNPRDTGTCLDIIREVRIPLLGVCFGHQAIAVAFGGEVSHSPSGPIHGKTTLIHHSGKGIYQGLPDPLVGGRYHSLAISRLPQELEVTARTEDGIIMGVKHKERPIFGLQFHPESVLTPDGLRIVENFLRMAKDMIYGNRRSI